MTVRRDIEVLARRGLVARVHGGATAVRWHSAEEPGFAAKSSLQTAQKDAIARAAAALVEAGASVAVSGGTTTTRRALAMSARSVSASTRLGVVNPARPVDAVHTEEQPVDVKGAQGGHGDGPDQGVGRRPLTAGEHDGGTGALTVQQISDRNGVRHDREVRNVPQLPRDGVGRRTPRDGHARAGLHQRRRGARDGVLLGGLQRRLGCEPRFLRAVPPHRRRAAVDAGHETTPGRGPRCHGARSCRTRAGSRRDRSRARRRCCAPARG